LERLCTKFELTDPYRALYPFKRDFTYSPFGQVRLNRSRIDFFITSSTLINAVSDCIIAGSPKCKLFDHKSVTLNLYRANQPKGKFKRSISNSFLNSKALRFAVELSARKAHLYSLDRQLIFPINLDDIYNSELNKVNQCLDHVGVLVTMLEKQALCGQTDATILQIAAHEQLISGCIEDMIPIDTIGSYTKRCGAKDFFVTLINETRSHGAKMQRILARHKTLKISKYNSDLIALKQGYLLNSHEISKLENELKLQFDSDLRERMKDIKIFECLNAEKATPLLVSLAKKSVCNESLDIIRDVNGEVFKSTSDRHEYIRNFYSELYKADIGVEGTIEDFLGPDISNHPIVLESKLKVEERDVLDKCLVIEELDRALEKANLRSAPGVDGYS
jgi:hypothetical protein